MSKTPWYAEAMPDLPTQRERDVYRFTCGDCHIFAKTIKRMRPHFKLATFIYGDQPDNHAFVICPDGDALDVCGKKPLASFCSDWCQTPADIKVWDSARDLNRFWSAPTFGDYSYRRAIQLAGKLLVSLGL